MKKILALVAVLCALFAGLTTWTSGRSESAFRGWVRQVSEQPHVRVLESAYERGRFRSTGTVSFEIRGPVGEAFRARLSSLGREDARGRIGLEVVHHIDHSGAPLWQWLRAGCEGIPIVSRVESRFELDQESQSELVSVVGRIPGVMVESLVRASGMVESDFSVPARTLEPRVGKDPSLASARGEWHGLTGRLLFSSDGTSLAGHIEAPGFELHSQKGFLRVSDLSAQFSAHVDFALDSSGVWLGTASHRIGSLTSGPATGGTGLHLQDWTLQNKAEVIDGALRLELAADLAAITAGRTQWGPARVRLALRDLDPALVGALSDSEASPSDDADGPAFPLPVLVHALSSHAPVLELEDFEFLTPGGPVLATARLSLDPGSGPPADLGSLMAAVIARLDLSGPAVLFETMLADGQGGAAALEERGLLERVGDRMQIHVEMRAGALRVNGNAINAWPVPSGEPADLADASFPRQ